MFSSSHRRTAIAFSLVFAGVAGGLAGCSQTTTEKAAEAASAAASDISSDVSSLAASVKTNAAQDFVTKAATANMFEIETSQAALKTSKNKAVLAFAKLMVKDHTAAGKKLEAVLASDTGITAPAALNDDQQKKLDDLTAKTGTDFDKAYADIQKDAHNDAVDLFDDYAKNGKDAALQSFASETLPTLQKHKEHAAGLNP